MRLLDPHDTLDDLPPGDHTSFWRLARHDGVECLSASFRTHEFPPHSHETFVVGVVTGGTNVYRVSGVLVKARPGQLCFVNPGEVHNTLIPDDGYAYRMTYPSIDFLKRLIARETGQAGGTPKFPAPVVEDRPLAEAFLAAHAMLERGEDALAADEAFLSVYLTMLQRHAHVAEPLAADGEPMAVRLAKEALAADLEQPPELSALAAATGLSPFHLIRVFRKATGLTPSAWLADRRIHLACKLLRGGMRATEVAASCGFYDQSHFTRTFKSRLGVTPGDFFRARAAA